MTLVWWWRQEVVWKGHIPISRKFTFMENNYGESEVRFTKLAFTENYLETIPRNCQAILQSGGEENSFLVTIPQIRKAILLSGGEENET